MRGLIAFVAAAEFVGVVLMWAAPIGGQQAGPGGLSNGFWVDGGQNPGAGVSTIEQVRTSGYAAAPTNGRPRRCIVYGLPPVGVGAAVPVSDQLATATSLVEGTHYYLECRYLDDGNVYYADTFLYQPGVDGPDAAAIARQVYDEVPLVFPRPRTAPPIDAAQLVGLSTWLWIEPGAFQTFTASAALPGISVTVTAEPLHVVWDMGDGATVTCPGPGTPWNPGGPDNQQTDCSHTYQFVSADRPDGVYGVSATVVWTVSWDASTGESGTLPDVTRTTTFSLEVTERQAVITYGRDG